MTCVHVQQEVQHEQGHNIQGYNLTAAALKIAVAVIPLPKPLENLQASPGELQRGKCLRHVSASTGKQMLGFIMQRISI